MMTLRKIIENNFNIRLRRSTHLHHINGNRHNNTVENLVLLPIRAHMSLHAIIRNFTECSPHEPAPLRKQLALYRWMVENGYRKNIRSYNPKGHKKTPRTLRTSPRKKTKERHVKKSIESSVRPTTAGERMTKHHQSKIKSWRNFRELTQTALATLAKVNAENICRYEKGTLTPTLATLGRLANALGVRITDLIDEDSAGGSHAHHTE